MIFFKTIKFDTFFQFLSCKFFGEYSKRISPFYKIKTNQRGKIKLDKLEGKKKLRICTFLFFFFNRKIDTFL